MRCGVTQLLLIDRIIARLRLIPCFVFTYGELTKRDKANLDIFWLKDDSLEDSANLPEPGVLALEITEDLEAALEQFAAIAEDLKHRL